MANKLPGWPHRFVPRPDCLSKLFTIDFEVAKIMGAGFFGIKFMALKK